jgi:hypothetical protein
MNIDFLGFWGTPSRPGAKLVAGIVGAALMFAVSGAQAACYNAQQQLSSQTISGFLGNPGQLLQQFPNGGAQLISQVRDLVASDPQTLQPVLQLIANANRDQKSAIGAALAQAARICVRGDQAFAAEIQAAIAQTKDHDVVLAFTSTSGDQPTGAVGGGVAGAGIGGQTNPFPGGPTGTGGPQKIGNDPTPTPLFSYSSSVSGTGGSSGTNTTTTTFFTIAGPVSR